jgi:hypothetical protein
MREARSTKPSPNECDHASVVLVNDRVLLGTREGESAYHVRCLACGAVGPSRVTAEEANRALLKGQSPVRSETPA